METINLLSVSMILLALDISYKWNYIIHGFFQLASFNEHCFEIQPCYMNPYSSFLLPDYTLLNGHSTSFLIHSTADGHCFCFLTIENNTAMRHVYRSICLSIYFQLLLFLFSISISASCNDSILKTWRNC